MTLINTPKSRPTPNPQTIEKGCSLVDNRHYTILYTMKMVVGFLTKLLDTKQELSLYDVFYAPISKNVLTCDKITNVKHVTQLDYREIVKLK